MSSPTQAHTSPAPHQEISAEQATRIAAAAADAKMGDDIVALEVTELTSIADFFLVVTGHSSTQVDAIYQSIDAALSQSGREPINIEGRGEGRWILMDYGDLVVHVFIDEARDFYGLERLWGDAPRLALGDDRTP
ncbi:MAG: ribosome silencing factor [Nitrospirota bacterium]|nr:ribosome silencing factor [Nitrospirota bacterium]